MSTLGGTVASEFWNDSEWVASCIEDAWRIRLVEERLLELYAQGRVGGTVHTCIGQELVPTTIARVGAGDSFWFSNHRGHGHYIARGGSLSGLFGEVLGLSSGCSAGYGGSQHLIAEGFISNGVQGGLASWSVGYGWRLPQELQSSVCFLGDGTLGTGPLYEAFALAGQLQSHTLFVLEDNGIAQSTPRDRTLRGSIRHRVEGFGIDYIFACTDNLEAFAASCSDAVNHAVNRGPILLHVETQRLSSHSKGDDTRAPDDVAAMRERDVLTRNPLSADKLHQLREEIDNALQEALQKSTAGIEGATRPGGRTSTSAGVPLDVGALGGPEGFPNASHRNQANGLIRSILYSNPRSTFIGEDIEHQPSPGGSSYAGAFGVSGSLSTEFPDQVRSVSISESAIVGVAAGRALLGHSSVCEVMFADFLPLVFDQVINQVSKVPSMYGRRIDLPLLIRTPAGAYRGYGPTHSQSLEGHFLGLPNVNVIAVNPYQEAKTEVLARLNEGSPVLLIEDKNMYGKPLLDPSMPGYRFTKSSGYCVLRPRVHRPSATVVTYGGVADMARQAVEGVLMERDIVVDFIVLTNLSPLPLEPVAASLNETQRLLVVEQGPWDQGLAPFLLAHLAGSLPIRWRVVGAPHVIPAAGDLERDLLPSVVNVMGALYALVEEVHGGGHGS